MSNASKCYSYLQQRPLLAIYVVAIVVLTLYNLTPASWNFDTSFYLLAAENLLHGKLDCLRTPVYPLLLKICSLPHQGEWLGSLVCILQSAVYLISIRSFYLLLCQLLSKQWIILLATLSYVLLPTAGWCNELLTESLSTSLSVILCHWLVRFHYSPTCKRALRIATLLLIMVMLRTNFIAFFVILPFFWLLQWASTKKHIFAIATMLLLIPIGGYVGYCKTFQNQYGIFAATISTACDYYNLKNSNLWNVELLTDEKEVATCRWLDSCARTDGSYAPMYHYINKTGDAQTIANACSNMKEQQKLLFAKYKVHLFLGECQASFHPLFAMHSGKTHTMLEGLLYTITTIFSMPLLIVYQFIIVLAVVLLIHCVRNKRFPPPLLFCYGA